MQLHPHTCGLRALDGPGCTCAGYALKTPGGTASAKKCPPFVPDSLVDALKDHRRAIGFYDDMVGHVVYAIPVPGAPLVKAATAALRILADGCSAESTRHEFKQAAEGFKIKGIFLGILAAVLPFVGGAVFSPYFAAGAAVALACVPIFTKLGQGKSPNAGDIATLGSALASYGAVSGVGLPSSSKLEDAKDTDAYRKKYLAQRSRIEAAKAAGTKAAEDAAREQRMAEVAQNNLDSWGTREAVAYKASLAFASLFIKGVKIEQRGPAHVPVPILPPTVERVRSAMEFLGRLFAVKGNAAGKLECAGILAAWTLEGKKLARAGKGDGSPPLDFDVAVKVLRARFGGDLADDAERGIREAESFGEPVRAPALQTTPTIGTSGAGEGDAPREGQGFPTWMKVVGALALAGLGAAAVRR